MPGPISDSYRGPPGPPDGSKHPNWPGRLTKIQAIRLIEQMSDKEDPYWEQLVDDYYHEESDTMPSMFHILAALGVTREQYLEAVNCNPDLDWPTS